RETRAQLGIVAVVVGQDLEGHLAPQAVVLRQVHLAHRPRAQRLADAGAVDEHAAEERHGALLPNHSRVFASARSVFHCAAVSGTTDRRPILTSGESANAGCALIASSPTGRASGARGLMSTTVSLGSLGSG